MFRRITLVLMIAAFAGAGATMQAQQLAVQDTVDWGTVVPRVAPGEVAKVHKKVKLTNTGDKVLKIEEVRPSCGCTSAPLDKDELAPGESTVMNVTLNLPISNGQLSKRITIRSNSVERPTRVMFLRANVQRPLQLSSSFIPFNRGSVGEEIKGSITVSVFGDLPVEMGVTSETENLKILTPELLVEPGKTEVIEVSFTPDKEGPFQAKIMLQTSLDGYEEFEILGYGAADPK